MVCQFLTSCNRVIGSDHYKAFCKKKHDKCNEYSGFYEKGRPSFFLNKERS